VVPSSWQPPGPIALASDRASPPLVGHGQLLSQTRPVALFVQVAVIDATALSASVRETVALETPSASPIAPAVQLPLASIVAAVRACTGE
jgi:hypothetical protein